MSGKVIVRIVRSVRISRVHPYLLLSKERTYSYNSYNHIQLCTVATITVPDLTR